VCSTVTKVTAEHQYARFRLVPKSTTLDDLEGSLFTLFALCFKTCTVILYLFIYLWEFK